MAASTGPVLAVGGITLLNETVLHAQPFNWKVPIATALAALALAGVERLSPELAVGIAYVSLVAVLFTRVNPTVPAPAESLANLVSGRKV